MSLSQALSLDMYLSLSLCVCVSLSPRVCVSLCLSLSLSHMPITCLSHVQGRVDEAIIMYQDMHKWDDALQVAEKKGHPQLEQLRAQYLEYLHRTDQGERRERDAHTDTHTHREREREREREILRERERERPPSAGAAQSTVPGVPAQNGSG
ncbi:MAG TPA: hypothetical protein V6C97_05650 [Oculatellaceae cyanobacterium]